MTYGVDVLSLLDRPIAFHRVFVTITGSVTAGVMLSQAFYWSRRTTLKDGWFYKKADEWTKETGLSRREQETARKVLRKLGILEETKRGIPATLHFRVSHEALIMAISAVPHETYNQDVRKTPNLIGGKGESNSETTAEITSEKERKERVPCSGTKGGAFVPNRKYPETEEEMYSTLERIGLEPNPDYDGNFFEQMDQNGWVLPNGEPVYDWVATYQARIHKATTF